MKRAILAMVIAIMLSACAGANQYKAPTDGTGSGSYGIDNNR